MSSGSGGASPSDPHQGSAPGPAGGLLSPVPRFCPPPKQISGYAPDRDIISFMTQFSGQVDIILGSKWRPSSKMAIGALEW